MVGWVCDEDASLRNVDILCLLGFSGSETKPSTDDLLARITLIRNLLHPDRLRKQTGVPKEIRDQTDRDIRSSNANALNTLVGTNIDRTTCRIRWDDIWRGGNQYTVQRWDPVAVDRSYWTGYFPIQHGQTTMARLRYELLTVRRRLEDSEDRIARMKKEVPKKEELDSREAALQQREVECAKEMEAKKAELDSREAALQELGQRRVGLITAMEENTTLKELRRLRDLALSMGLRTGSFPIGMIRRTVGEITLEHDVIGSLDVKGRLNFRARNAMVMDAEYPHPKASVNIEALTEYFSPFAQLADEPGVIAELLKILKGEDLPEDIIQRARQAARKSLDEKQQKRKEYMADYHRRAKRRRPKKTCDHQRAGKEGTEE